MTAKKTPAAKKPKAKTESPVEALVEIDGEPGLEGHFVNVVSGEHDGRCGTFAKVLETHKDGSPKTILIRTRDANDELLPVAYRDVRHTTYKGGR